MKPGFDTKFIKIEKRYNITVLSKLMFFALHDGICGSLHNKQQFMHRSAQTASCTITQNLDEDSVDMLYKNYC